MQHGFNLRLSGQRGDLSRKPSAQEHHLNLCLRFEPAMYHSYGGHESQYIYTRYIYIYLLLALRGAKSSYFIVLLGLRGAKSSYFIVLLGLRGAKSSYYIVLLGLRGAKSSEFILLLDVKGAKSSYYIVLLGLRYTIRASLSHETLFICLYTLLGEEYI